MNIRQLCIMVALCGSLPGVASQTYGADATGSIRAGFVTLDEEGSAAVNQPTFNAYEGAALSLEDFGYRFDNGTRVSADLRNLTLNNRKLRFGITQSGRYSVTLRNNQYRRTYGADGAQFTRRRTTSGEVWIQPHRYVRLFGGYGQTAKHGTMIELFEPTETPAFNRLDYTQNYYHAGIRLKQGRRQTEFEYRGGSFSDDVSGAGDRASRRFRLTATSPVPRFEKLVVSGGLQHYSYELTERLDTLAANTGWLGLRFYPAAGISLQYSFVIDRARRTGDLAPTDNISNAFYATKVWPRSGGVTVGYQQRLNDDVLDDVSTRGLTLSGWVKPMPEFTVKAGYGSENKEVDAGRTLTGDSDFSRHFVSMQYDLQGGSRARVKYASRQTENDQIGSSADFVRLGGDLWLHSERFGDLQVSYAYLDGEYDNSAGVFGFKDHVVSGDLMPIEYRQFSAGVGGTYVRSQEDVDVESFVFRMSAGYAFRPDYRLELKYAAHNFDNLADTSPLYSEYYTANIVEMYLIKSF